jgi:O-succinylbenzoate synthase
MQADMVLEKELKVLHLDLQAARDWAWFKNNEFTKFLGKWMELENVILNEVTQSQKNTHGMHSLISGY